MDTTYETILARVMGCRGIISIDGRSGSGKTTLASLLAEKLACDIIHTDDFYMPFSERLPDWMDIPAGNMDLAHLEARVKSARCPVLVEGSYSQHPSLAGLYELKIFLTCSADEQASRLSVREGDHFQAFRDIWIPLEEKYFAAFDIPSHADIVYDTTVV